MVDQMFTSLESLLCLMEDDDCRVLAIVLQQTLRLEPLHEATVMLRELQEVFERRARLEFLNDDAVELRKMVRELLAGYSAVT